MDMTLRREMPGDWQAVERLTRDAFWRDSRIAEIGIGADEHYLALTLRMADVFVPLLDIVAEADGQIIGNVMYSMAYVKKTDGMRLPVLNFGPLSVMPAYQKMGVGSALMRFTIQRARKLGYGAILFFGHPEYYPRFGFTEAAAFGIATHEGKNYPAFMAMELKEGYLDGAAGGTFHESPLYDVDAEMARAYDAANFS